MIDRSVLPLLVRDLAQNPAVALLGPRQVGKTTAALAIASNMHSVYLDLESEQDRARLLDAEAYLQDRTDRLVILDEVHRMPEVFPLLRGQIDRARRQGQKTGLYLLLGSASLALLQQAGESLAGRISYLEMTPLGVSEVPHAQHKHLWLRGGYPEAFLAADDTASLRWRENFIRAYVERDMPMFGQRMGAQALRRLWGMLAHQQGGLFNASELARALGVDTRTVSRSVDLMEQLFLLRRLQPWHTNLGKRLTKSPKLYVRDTGLLHALMGLNDEEALLSHPVAGLSWETFAIENIVAAAGQRASPYFYRTAAGAEIDLLLVWPNADVWAIEVKRNHAPKPARGFYSACDDLKPTRRLLVYPGPERFGLGQGIEATPLAQLCAELTG